jgi:bifunctional non-homologous end joining protein LigD
VPFQRRKPEAIGLKASLPGFVEPALASSIEKVPSGARWIHEIKFDGYRVQVHLANEAAKIFTRRGHDWTHRFKKVAHDAWRIKLFQRKAELKKILTGTDIQFSDSFEIDGREMFAHACKLGLEGVVSKVRDSAYPTGRTNDWVKKTCAQRETLTIAGFALDGMKWDGLYVGRRKGDDLIYAGKVDHGFDKVSAADLQKRLKPLIRRTQPYSKRIAHKGIWVEPKLLAEVEYRAKSAEGKVRHPFFRGLREDL